ncbi:hypothetical protein, partial [Clavibacter michiganensis]|uniref:hypothetical protein n=1 Tax=Clavibacter michiganensis TaxID=28447 RepID=UPI00293199BF
AEKTRRPNDDEKAGTEWRGHNDERGADAKHRGAEETRTTGGGEEKPTQGGGQEAEAGPDTMARGRRARARPAPWAA